MKHSPNASCPDADTIAALVRAIDGLVNVMARRGAPKVPALGRIGVARVSLGPALTLASLATTQREAREVLEHGTYGALEQGLPFGDANGMFDRASQ